mgnify:CR=1 FL=1
MLDRFKNFFETQEAAPSADGLHCSLWDATHCRSHFCDEPRRTTELQGGGAGEKGTRRSFPLLPPFAAIRLPHPEIGHQALLKALDLDALAEELKRAQFGIVGTCIEGRDSRCSSFISLFSFFRHVASSL